MKSKGVTSTAKLLGWLLLSLLILAGESRYLEKTSTHKYPPPASSTNSQEDILLDNTPEMDEIRELLQDIDDIIDDVLPEGEEGGRRKRNSPFSPPQTCQVTEEELTGLLTALANSPQHRRPNSASSSTNMVVNPRCKQLLLIKDGINDLVNKLNDLTQSASLGAKYQELKRVYEQEIIDLKRLIEDEKRQASQESQFKFDALLNKFQQLNVKLNEVLRNYENEKRLHIATKIQLCVAKIKDKDYDTARSIFKALKDSTHVKEIVRLAYRAGTSRRRITYFLDNLTILQVALGKISLYEEAMISSPGDSNPRNLKTLLVKLTCGLNYSGDSKFEAAEFCKSQGQAYSEFTSFASLYTDLNTFKNVDRDFYYK